MKLVFATEYYHPWAPGGTAWSLELLARALIARGHSVTVVTPNYGAAAAEDVNGVDLVASNLLNRVVMPALEQAENAFSATLARINVEDLARSAEGLRKPASDG